MFDVDTWCFKVTYIAFTPKNIQIPGPCLSIQILHHDSSAKCDNTSLVAVAVCALAVEFDRVESVGVDNQCPGSWKTTGIISPAARRWGEGDPGDIPADRPMKQWPVFRMMSLKFFALAKLTPAMTSFAFWARMVYCDRKPRVQEFGHPAGGPGCPVAVSGGHVLLLQSDVIGMLAWSALRYS